ncbi:MAG: hypothetical protein P9L98_05485 [Candidatus Kaelpia imicola]|nr:hypothetical protein [Candidatus Kaelpia imicola]
MLHYLKYGFEKETGEVNEDGEKVKVFIPGLQQNVEKRAEEAGITISSEVTLTEEERILVSAITQEEYFKILNKKKEESSGYRVEIAEGVFLDYGLFMELKGGDFTQFVSDRGLVIADLAPAEIYALTLIYANQKAGKTYGAILPYAVETPDRAGVWEAARAALRQIGMQDLLEIGPPYEHSYRQYFMQGHDRGFFTFIVPTDPGSQIIPGDKIPEFTTGMQNALQALGTQEALGAEGRLSVRIEIEGSVDDSISAIEKFFIDVKYALMSIGVKILTEDQDLLR